MKKYGFLKVAAAVPISSVANVEHNVNEIKKLVNKACLEGASLVVFPELSITSYTCGDLFLNSSILNKAFMALKNLVEFTSGKNIAVVVGLPLAYENKIYNTAAFLFEGKIKGIIPKTFIPNYSEFYEQRWFESGAKIKDKTIEVSDENVPFGTNIVFRDNSFKDFTIGLEICEDLWVPIPPSSYSTQNGATVVCNLSASNILTGKNDYRKLIVSSQSAKSVSAYIYANTGFGESTTDVVFDGASMIYENGVKLSENNRFEKDGVLVSAIVDIHKLVAEREKMNSFQFNYTGDNFKIIPFELKENIFEFTRYYEQHPFVPSNNIKLNERCEEIFNIQSNALLKRLYSAGNPKAVIGLSGGLDSTLALLVTIKAFDMAKRDRKDIIAVTMPGFGTTSKTYNLVLKLVSSLGVTFKEYDIKDISTIMLNKIGHDESLHDITYENVQARARTYILMTEANLSGGIVIGTGDLSEIALGWSTYNGDHISMYNVNSSIPKTLVRSLIRWASTLFDINERKIFDEILNMPVSPELLPPVNGEISQKTEDVLGPYELHDFFLYHFIRYGFSAGKLIYIAQKTFKDVYDEDFVEKIYRSFIKRFMRSQWKRDCVPGGPKVGSIDLSPRGSWRMPADINDDDFNNFQE